MLTHKDLHVAKKLVKSTSKIKYYRTGKSSIDCIINYSTNLSIIISDDLVSEAFRSVYIKINNDKPIKRLKVTMNSGRFHDRGNFHETVIGYDSDDEYSCSSFTIQINNLISELIVTQNTHTEDLYSSHKNRDGFSPSTLEIECYNIKHSMIKTKGNVKINNAVNSSYSLVIRSY